MSQERVSFEEDRLLALERRVQELERKRKLDTHEHRWRYAKSMTLPDRHVFYTWECEDSEICLFGKAGTNSAGNLPDHFPSDLR